MAAFLLTIVLLSNISLAYGMTEQSTNRPIYEYTVTEAERNIEFERQKQRIMDEIASIEPTGEYDYIYEHDYGSKKEVTISGFLANQPSGGTQFPTGGGFYVSTSGGASYSISVAFPKPYDMVSVSADIGYVTDSGVYIAAPNKTGYFKAYGEKDFEIQPLIVWRIHRFTGERSIYYRTTLQTHLRSRYYAKSV